jgi:hypothetical protein
LARLATNAAMSIAALCWVCSRACLRHAAAFPHDEPAQIPKGAAKRTPEKVELSAEEVSTMHARWVAAVALRAQQRAGRRLLSYFGVVSSKCEWGRHV